MAQEKLPQIRVTSNSAGEGVIQKIVTEAMARGINTNSFIIQIFESAIKNESQYNDRLKNVRKKGGDEFSIRLPRELKERIDNWALQRATSKATLSNFILEKWLELNEI